MTWNELIHTLQNTIPEHRREEQAVWFHESILDEGVQIDAIEERSIQEDFENGIVYDATSGDEDNDKTFVLTP